MMTKEGDLALLSQSPVTTSTSTSWFERMQDALVTFCLGWVLLIFSIPVLWFNESRSAKMESIISWGSSQCRTVSGKVVEKEDRNWLVHIDGEQTKAMAKVSDPQFSNVTFDTDCLRLRRSVEVFQIIEHEKKQEKEKLGGGKETITTYTYTEEWSGMFHDSSSYQEGAQRRNTKPQDLQLGADTTNCGRVEYGQAYVLTDALVNQCDDFKDASERIGGVVNLTKSALKFKRDGGNFYFYSRNSNSTVQNPHVGDARAKFEYVPDGTVTIVALQVCKDGDARDSFLPYRLIQRGWCGTAEEEQKRRLYKEGNKSKSQLADEAMCGGCLGCLCCACNLVMTCFAAALTAEIYHLFNGSKEAYECFKIIKARNQMLTWVLRLAGWSMMFIGLYLLFQPFLTLIVVLPVVGPYLSSFAGALIWFLCLVSTLTISSVIIIIAYLFFHPMVAFLYSLGLGVVIAGVVVVSKMI